MPVDGVAREHVLLPDEVQGCTLDAHRPALEGDDVGAVAGPGAGAVAAELDVARE